MAQTKSFQKLRTQAKADMQHHMNILQSRLAKAENHEVRADRAEQAQRNMAAEIKRLRAALQRIADQDVDADLKGQADILAGIAWAALDAAPSPC